MSLPLRLFRNFVHGLRRYWEGNVLDALPLRKAVRGYNGEALKGDTVAGVNVALLAFPQGMAYAVIAEIPIAYGISCSAVAALVAPLFAGSRHTILGPTNATAFMLFSSFAALGLATEAKIALLPLLVFMVGIMLVLGALFRMADLVQYISRSVVVGYITGAAILIIGNQMRHLFGVDPPSTAGAKNFFTILAGIWGELGHLKPVPLVLGVVTFAIYWGLSLRFRKLPIFALTLVLMSGAAWFFRDYAGGAAMFEPYQLKDLVPHLPDFGAAGFAGDFGNLFGIAFAVAFLASLENSVMAKTLASRSGERTNANQDMLSVGMTNLATSVLSGMPASGSLTRSALNFASGAVTPVSSLICGVLCVAGAVTLGPLIQYVPKAVLAALVIGIAVSLINFRNLRICLAATRSDAVTVGVTFLATLLMPLHVAIFVGVGISIALYLRKASRPQLVEYEFTESGNLQEREDPKKRANPLISIVHVEGALFFGAAELFRTQIQRVCQDDNLRIIVLRMKNAYHLDATSVMALEELILFLRSNKRDLIISGAMRDLYRVLKNAGMVEVIGRENIFMGSTANPNLSTRNALKRAQVILGGEKAEVKIFHDPTRPRE